MSCITCVCQTRSLFTYIKGGKGNLRIRKENYFITLQLCLWLCKDSRRGKPLATPKDKGRVLIEYLQVCIMLGQFRLVNTYFELCLLLQMFPPLSLHYYVIPCSVSSRFDIVSAPFYYFENRKGELQNG